MAPASHTERDLKGADGAASSMDLGEDVSLRDSARDTGKFQGSNGSLMSNSKYRLRRPGTEAEISSDSSLKSFDVVYVTTAAEEALFGLVSKEASSHALCVNNESPCGAVCG